MTIDKAETAVHNVITGRAVPERNIVRGLGAAGGCPGTKHFPRPGIFAESKRAHACRAGIVFLYEKSAVGWMLNRRGFEQAGRTSRQRETEVLQRLWNDLLIEYK